MDKELRRKVASFFEHVKANGSKRSADREKVTATFEKPSWFDLEKFELGNQTGREYFFSIFTAHLSGLVILVYNESILETLISTGNSKNILSLFRRYFNTAINMKKWYDGDVWNEGNVAFKSIFQIRSIHKKVMDERNKGFIENVDILKFSQLDMFMTQYAFLGQIVANGNQFGLRLKDEELSGLIHFWRCIGHLLGIEDQFNLFTNEDLEFQRCLCSYILEVEIKPNVQNSTSEDAKSMSWAICASIKGIVSLIYANTFLKFSLMNNGLVQQAEQIKLTFFERALLRIMSFTFDYVYQFSIARKFFNRLLNISFERTEQQFASKSKKLSLTYPNVHLTCTAKNKKDYTAISL